MKKLTAFLLSILLLLSLTACGGTQNTQTSSESGGKVFVVYFSASGNTERVAREIAAVTDGTLFALTPTEPYTTEDLNWSDADSRVSREHSDESLRDIPLLECTPADWDSYGTVLIGYPIWWGSRMARKRLCDGQRLHRQDRHPLRDLGLLRAGRERRAAGEADDHRRLAARPALPLRCRCAGDSDLGRQSRPVISPDAYTRSAGTPLHNIEDGMPAGIPSLSAIIQAQKTAVRCRTAVFQLIGSQCP